MSISITQPTIGGEATWLVLAEPDWSMPVRVRHEYLTEIARGVTGVESRRPLRTVPRLTIEYRFSATEAEVELWRNFVGTLGDERVAVALWPDASALDLTALYDPQVSAGWNAGFTSIAVAESGGTPAGAYTAPLVIGRLQRGSIDYLDAEQAIITVKVVEESPWSARVDIDGSAPSSFPVAPDWASPPTEKTSDLLDFDDVGDGRELASDGEDLVRWQQSAQFTLDRAGLSDLMRFWKGRRGGFGAFAMDSFFGAGTDTPQAPLVFSGTGGRGYMRFAGDVLEVEFETPSLATVKATFDQVLDATNEQSDPFAYLFEIYSDADPADVARLTSYESPITYNSQTWTPARIEMGELKSSLKIENDTAKIEVDLRDLPQIAPILRHETITPVRVKVYLADLSTNPATASVLRFGMAGKWKLKGQRASFEVRPFAGILERKVPRFMLSRTCNFALFDGGCGVDKDSYKVTGDYKVTYDGGRTIVCHNLAGVPSGIGDNWFQNGWVEIGTGIDRQVRTITNNWWDAANSEVHLTLSRPIRTDVASVGADVAIYAGCDGSYGTCVSKFSNGQKFGGAPFAPVYLPNRSTGFTGGGGK